MSTPQRGFYTLIGWATWKAAKWYLARKLGLRSKARKGAVVLLVAAAGGGAFSVARRRGAGTTGA
jgi:hypothetical protein